MKINKNDIILAEVRYYDKEHNGLEITKETCYALISKFNDGYYNLLNLKEQLSLLKRIPYSNCIDGFEYGTKVIEVTPIINSGLCYLEVSDMGNYFKKNFIGKEDLENFVLNSNYYFREKKDIAKRRLKSLDHPKEMMKILVMNKK